MKFVIGKRLWVEDDATHGLDDHESLGDAWREITGSRFRDGQTVVELDYGDCFEYVKRVGDRVYFVRSAPDVSEIYEAKEE